MSQNRNCRIVCVIEGWDGGQCSCIVCLVCVVLYVYCVVLRYSNEHNNVEIRVICRAVVVPGFVTSISYITICGMRHKA